MRGGSWPAGRQADKTICRMVPVVVLAFLSGEGGAREVSQPWKPRPSGSFAQTPEQSVDFAFLPVVYSQTTIDKGRTE